MEPEGVLLYCQVHSLEYQWNHDLDYVATSNQIGQWECVTPMTITQFIITCRDIYPSRSDMNAT